MSTTAGQFFTNQNLFSTNYLKNRLLETSFWKDHEVEAAEAFATVDAAYKDIQGLKLGPGEEASLEDRFIRPILKTLGFAYDVQPVTQRGTRKRRPDYALFASEADLREVRKDKTNLKRFFSHALSIAEAKYWNRPLNDTVKDDALDSRDATAQLVKYLDDVWLATDGKILWGVLTNGKLWRLFYYRAASRSGHYYEVDLEEILRSGDVDSFKYFYLFFARDAFVTDPQTGKTWLDQHLEGSETYAKIIGEKLKERIFDHVFERLAEGFLEYRRNELRIKIEDEASLNEIFNGCLTLLYRLLFILYAESRELLPVSDKRRYYRYSLRKLQRDVSEDLSRIGLGGMSHQAYSYWSRLESLCRIIDKGDKALNVPTYNGGLFQSSAPDEDQSAEAKAVRFIRDHKLADPFLAEAIEALTADDDPAEPGKRSFIDYSSLGVRHINLTTPKKERIQLLDKGKKLYERCLAKGDQACVLGFVEHALKQTPEQADVVHDLLAFLAEQMIEMNKTKQTEAKDFLSWLEREIGAKVDNLRNKTKLEDYHEGTFEGLLKVLKENRRSLTIDPSRREFQGWLEKEYANSFAKLGPLKARIEATDHLIDQIVYRLYGLTEEEVKIIEGSAANEENRQ